ncbi:MAG: iron-sulfur cluster assembly accessory protein [Nitrososphaerota archaeon]
MESFRITLTERAARKIKEYLASEGDGLALRVFIAGQGCCGYKYGMALDDEALEGDVVIHNNGVKIVVDKYSAQVLDNSEIDYIEDERGSGFTVKNPNEQSTCSCGGHHHALE